MSDQHIRSRIEDVLDPVTKQPVMKVRIDEVRAELAPERLAVRLAEAMETQGEATADAIAFKAQADDDRRKAQRLQNTLFQIQQGTVQPDINPRTGKPYRMQMEAGFDEEAVKAELEMRRARAQEFTQKADRARAQAAAAKAEAARLRSELAKARRG